MHTFDNVTDALTKIDTLKSQGIAGYLKSKLVEVYRNEAKAITGAKAEWYVVTKDDLKPVGISCSE